MSKIVKYDPFEELRTLQRHFFGDDLMAQAASSIPTTDVYTVGDKLMVEAHLPNFEQGDVDIQIDGDNLVISAERHEQAQDKQKKYIVRESSSSFYRSISLPQRARVDQIEANLVDGVLRVSVPLAPLPEPKKVQVKVQGKMKQ